MNQHAQKAAELLFPKQSSATQQIAAAIIEQHAIQPSVEEYKKKYEEVATQLFKANEILYQVTKLSTGQDASPHQCGVVAMADDYFSNNMDYLVLIGKYKTVINQLIQALKIGICDGSLCDDQECIAKRAAISAAEQLLNKPL